MTDAERQELIKSMRASGYKLAADEIERLAKELDVCIAERKLLGLGRLEAMYRAEQAERERDELKAEQSRLTEKLAW